MKNEITSYEDGKILGKITAAGIWSVCWRHTAIRSIYGFVRAVIVSLQNKKTCDQIINIKIKINKTEIKKK